jgi:hypothetical protein
MATPSLRSRAVLGSNWSGDNADVAGLGITVYFDGVKFNSPSSQQPAATFGLLNVPREHKEIGLCFVIGYEETVPFDPIVSCDCSEHGQLPLNSTPQAVVRPQVIFKLVTEA